MKKDIIQIRSTEQEKDEFKKQAKNKGFDSLSQYIRNLIRKDK